MKWGLLLGEFFGGPADFAGWRLAQGHWVLRVDFFQALTAILPVIFPFINCGFKTVTEWSVMRQICNSQRDDESGANPGRDAAWVMVSEFGYLMVTESGLLVN